MKNLKIGMVAPDFTLMGDDGQKHKISQHLGKKNVVLAFYPKDFTGGWTAELRSLRDELSRIEATGTVVYGISTDDQESHKKFSQAEEFGFSLLADVDHAVSQQYSGLRGQSLSNRVTFVIDHAGYIRVIDKEVDVQNHGSDLVKIIEGTTQYQIKVGQPAPDFIAHDQDGKTHQISNLKGKKNVILAFYPADMTPGWTMEVCSLRDELNNFETLEVAVYGVSVQNQKSHKKFADKHSLGFPLLVDTGRNISLLYHAISKPEGNCKRITILIGKNGDIVQIDDKVSVRKHGRDLIDFIKSLN